MTSPTYIDRLCWWCQGKLAKTHSLAKTPDGDVRVHAVCKELAEDEFRKLTAQVTVKQSYRE